MISPESQRKAATLLTELQHYLENLPADIIIKSVKEQAYPALNKIMIQVEVEQAGNELTVFWLRSTPGKSTVPSETL